MKYQSGGQADKDTGRNGRSSCGGTQPKVPEKAGQKNNHRTYKYLADCDGAWGELHYDFKDGTAEIILLAEWDTMVSHRFAVRAFEHFRIHHSGKLPKKFY